MEVFPERVRKLWNDWELRVMILLSLFLQIILFLLGNRRKYVSNIRIGVILWVAYLLADWVALASLGIMSANSQSNCNNSVDLVLNAFWSPFLLLHLGGPDTITAYSLEDNELWFRHLLQLFFQAGGGFYVFLKFWNGTLLSILTIPMFLVGIIKYGERTWVLRSASINHLRESTRNSAAANFTALVQQGKNEGTLGSNILLNARALFEQSKRLFMDLILGHVELMTARNIFQGSYWKDAFEVIDVELGFMYDVLYTKTSLVYTRSGGILQSISFSSIILVLLVFLMIEKQRYSNSDVFITYLLLVGAVVLEVYAILVLLSSDWTAFWLNRHKNQHKILSSRFVDWFMSLRNPKRWSNSMAQYNLIRICLDVDKSTTFHKIQKFLCVDEMLDKYYYRTFVEVSNDLKELIFQRVKEKSMEKSGLALDFREGIRILLSKEYLEEHGWSVEVEFDHSVLLWHIATNFCYYKDQERQPNKQCSKLVSDYMLYLLVMCPFLFSNKLGVIRFRDTCDEAMKFFRGKNISNVPKACQLLVRDKDSLMAGYPTKSVLQGACMLADSLQSLEATKRWEIISLVWLEMLCYAAVQCSPNTHAQLVRRGVAEYKAMARTHTKRMFGFAIFKQFSLISAEK